MQWILVWCLANSWCFAARDFGLPLGASDEHTRQWSVRSEQRRGRPKELLPEGLRRKWPGASLLLSHRSLRICSFVAPRPRPFWAQRNTSYLRDTTLAFLNRAWLLAGHWFPSLTGLKSDGRVCDVRFSQCYPANDHFCACGHWSHTVFPDLLSSGRGPTRSEPVFPGTTAREVET